MLQDLLTRIEYDDSKYLRVLSPQHFGVSKTFQALTSQLHTVSYLGILDTFLVSVAFLNHKDKFYSLFLLSLIPEPHD